MFEDEDIQRTCYDCYNYWLALNDIKDDRGYSTCNAGTIMTSLNMSYEECNNWESEAWCYDDFELSLLKFFYT